MSCFASQHLPCVFQIDHACLGWTPVSVVRERTKDESQVPFQAQSCWFARSCGKEQFSAAWVILPSSAILKCIQSAWCPVNPHFRTASLSLLYGYVFYLIIQWCCIVFFNSMGRRKKRFQCIKRSRNSADHPAAIDQFLCAGIERKRTPANHMLLVLPLLSDPGQIVKPYLNPISSTLLKTSHNKNHIFPGMTHTWVRISTLPFGTTGRECNHIDPLCHHPLANSPASFSS